MTDADRIGTRYGAELRGLGGSLPDDLLLGARALEGRLSAEELDRWAATGVRLAHHALRSWEAASEYYRTSPHLVSGPGVSGPGVSGPGVSGPGVSGPGVSGLGPDALSGWAEVGMELAERSSLIAAAFLRATPEVLHRLPVPGQGQMGAPQAEFLRGDYVENALRPWARLGATLYHDNWKSISLASLFFGQSARLYETLPPALVESFVALLNTLSERSYQLSTALLETGADVFRALPAPDREPFLRFAQAVAVSSWADTRLYFERGPALLAQVDAAERAAFLQLSARVTASVQRQGFPLFVDAVEALGVIPAEQHRVLIRYATRLANGSPLAAMSMLRSAPWVLERLRPEQFERWYDEGRRILYDEENVDGAEAYFGLESTRAEEILGMLSARVDLSAVQPMLRLYAKALTGQPIAIRSTEDLVEHGIGWVEESVATTEGTSIYLPPYVGSFAEQQQNALTYKVFATHQTGRIEFGSFRFRLGVPGAHAPERLAARVAAQEGATADGRPRAVTEMQRYYNAFAERALIASLFTIVEDTRVDAYVAREYGGIRRWLRELQSWEVERRGDVSSLALRDAFVENLLRVSLGRADAVRWPQVLERPLAEAIAALRVVEQPGATVQDAAEVAAVLYDLAVGLPNITPQFAEGEWAPPADDLISINPMMPGGGEGQDDLPPMPSSSEEFEYQPPEQPESRGEFKPELVQLLMRLQEQREGMGGDAVAAPLTPEQLMDLLEQSTEIAISDIAEGDFASSVGLFLTNLEKEGATPASEGRADREEGDGDEGGGSGGGEEDELPVEIHYAYYDEWDFRASDYRPRWARVAERLGDEGTTDYYDEVLQRHHGLVMETRRQFEAMRPESFRRIKRLEDGEEIDLDLAIEFLVDRRAGIGPQARFYWRRNKVERDVAVAFLVDMSASTDEEIEKQKPDYSEDDEFDGDPRKYFQWLAQRRARMAAEPPQRIIDLEKESMVLIVEALEAIGDAYGIYGFSGYGRDNVEFHVIKELGEAFNDRVRRRIDQVQPVRSTRMGPAIRHAAHKLQEFDAKVKLLILVSDGRPQDHGYGRDRTEKEYAVHDTHQALVEARRNGITPFLITVDKEGHDYLGDMCADMGYEVVDQIEDLPRRLTSLYRALAAE